MAASTNASRSCCIFDKQAVELFKGLREIGKVESGDAQDNTSDSKTISEGHKKMGNFTAVPDEVSDKTGCSCLICQVTQFDSLEAQRDHFKLDWHRFNVKQKLMCTRVLPEEEFEETISGELSSISGSDTSGSECEDDAFTLESSLQSTTPAIQLNEELKTGAAQVGRHHPKLFLTNENSTIFTLYRAVIYSSRFVPDSDEESLARTLRTLEETTWIILMTAGGHFAGAVFEGEEVIAHKTFHRYTVRAKRGTAQGLRDSQQGKQPKSAGATLRRYNEAALMQEVQDLLDSWSTHISQCHKMFIRVPTNSQQMFFGGKKPPLSKDDPRIRTIPFATRRPTFNEVKRVHKELSKIYILGKTQDDALMAEIMNKLRSPNPKKSSLQSEKEPNISEPFIDNQDKASSAAIDEDNVDATREDAGERVANANKKNKKKSNKTRKPKTGQQSMTEITSTAEIVLTSEQHLWNRMYCAVVSGNMDVINELLGKENFRIELSQDKTDTETDRCHQACINISPSDLKQTDRTIKSTSEVTEKREDQLIEPIYQDHSIEGDGTESDKQNKIIGSSLQSSTSENAAQSEKSIEQGMAMREIEDISGDGSGQKFHGENSSGMPGSEEPQGQSQDSLGQGEIEAKTEGTISGSDSRHIFTCDNSDAKPDAVKVLSERWGQGYSTLLHAAARSPYAGSVYLLLEMGADPTLRDNRGRTPYDAADNKDARNEFRRFMADYPEKYDYSKAHIPSPLTQDQQADRQQKEAEKKKAQRKAKKQRTKEKKVIEQKKCEEEQEKERLLKMSDREKRALAAERRFAVQQSDVKGEYVQERCAMCSRSLAGRVPFERLSYKYCNTACVREHRLVLENS